MIKINNIIKKYGKNVILNQMTYEFKSSGITCLLGPSGCGKTTLLNLLAGFDTDYSGNISAFGNNITSLSADELCQFRKENIGYVFQNYNLVMGYTVLENILLASDLNNHTENENIIKAKELASQLGILSKIEDKVENLSGGQKQRVAIARALINDPQIILADEPTGALDRSTSSEIMAILKTISKERLVLIITHDKKICDYADEVISIVDGQVNTISHGLTDEKNVVLKDKCYDTKAPFLKRAFKNFRLHFMRYLLVSISVAIGIALCIVSFSSKNNVELSIDQFIDKNVAFNNGFIIKQEIPILDLLKNDSRIENVYPQYLMEDLSITFEGTTIEVIKKVPLPKATTNMAYGTMPRNHTTEIVLSPSLAKQLSDDIQSLIGKNVNLQYNNQTITLKVTGIFDYEYDNFFISSNIEKSLYDNQSEETCYSISYDVTEFSDIVRVTEWLEGLNLNPKTAAKQVEAFEVTFNKINRLFTIFSGIILVIGLAISFILLVKLMEMRYREIGLLSALGYNKSAITAILWFETLMLSLTATLVSGVILFVSNYIYNNLLEMTLIISVSQLVMTAVITFATISSINLIVSKKLINTEPADALRK